MAPKASLNTRERAYCRLGELLARLSRQSVDCPEVRVPFVPEAMRKLAREGVSEDALMWQTAKDLVRRGDEMTRIAR